MDIPHHLLSIKHVSGPLPEIKALSFSFREQASRLVEGKRGPKPVTGLDDPERLYGEVGRLKMELDWLKKRSGLSLPTSG